MFSVPTEFLDSFQEQVVTHLKCMCWYKYVQLVLCIQNDTTESKEFTQAANVSMASGAGCFLGAGG